jgi:hypothetical protein
VSEDVPRLMVAVLCKTAIISEGLAHALDGMAEVRRFPAGQSDVAGLLDALAPDAVVVDTAEDLEAAAEFATLEDKPLVHVLLREEKLRVMSGGRWAERDGVDASPEAIRNLILGGIYGRRPGS